MLGFRHFGKSSSIFLLIPLGNQVRLCSLCCQSSGPCLKDRSTLNFAEPSEAAMNRNHVTVLWTLLVSLLVQAMALADVVKTKDGRQFKGEVTEEGDTYVIK